MATFMADVYLGERFGVARYDREIQAARAIYEQLKRDGKDHALSFKSWKTEKDVGGRLPYNKGAWVLHLLKQELGEDVFWRGMAEYTRSNWGRGVSSEDFQHAMEKAAWRNLSPFFDQWIYN